MKKLWQPRAGWIAFECPGCGGVHGIPVDGSRGWQWNGSLESPTITPSIKVESYYGEERKHFCCHSTIDNGMISFCLDCTHDLRNATVSLADVMQEDKL